MTVVTASSRGQIVIPKEIRDKMGLKPGDEVTFIKKEWGILMVPVRDDLENLMGSVDVEGQQDFEKVREEFKRKRGKVRGK